MEMINPKKEQVLNFSTSVPLLAVLLIGSLLSPMSIRADGVTPIQIGLFEPVQLFDEDTTVIGLRFNLFYGENDEVYGLDAGLVNGVDDYSAGLAFGAVNYSDDHTGIQIGLFNYSDELFGAQIGVANLGDDSWSPQLGVFNSRDDGFFPMVAVALNAADDVYGGQFSAGINDADFASIQLAGLGNLAEGTYIQIAGGVNDSVTGLIQLAGLYSGGEAPLQISGLANDTDEGFLQISVGLNLSIEATQIGSLNVSQRSYFQLSAFGNQSPDSPVQVSGAVNSGESSSLQLAGLVNYGSSHFQLAGLSNIANRSLFQVSAINDAENAALQLGLFNQSDSRALLGLGLLNLSKHQTGLSIGLVNDTETLSGYQIGLINIARRSPFPFTLLFNAGSEESNRLQTGYIEASWTPFQFSLYAPGQVFSEATDVYGIRINGLYGVSGDVRGLDLGLLNWSSSHYGVQAGGGNVVVGHTAGLQIGLTNANLGSSSAVSIAGLVLFTEGHVNGLGLAPVVWTSQDVPGVQLGLVNRGNRFALPQLGGLNLATAAPFQLGLIGNFSEAPPPAGQIALLANSTGTPGSSAKDRDSMEDNGPDIANDTEALGADLTGDSNSTGMVIPYQLSLGYNQANRLSLFQIGGINLSAHSPVQLGLANSARSGSGFQLAVFANESGSGDLDPIAQISAFYNEGHGSIMQVAFLNAEEDVRNLQIGFASIANEGGLQLGAFNLASDGALVQIGLVNGSFFNDQHNGFRLGMINLSERSRGLSIGVWNIEIYSDGSQLGLFNFARSLDGVQIGLINIHANGSIPLTLGVNF